MNREEQLKKAIDKKFPCHSADVTGNYQRQVQRRIGTHIALFTPSILRHADPEVMKQAGWVREEEESQTHRNAELVSAFIEHCNEFGLNIPDHLFESFFNA